MKLYKRFTVLEDGCLLDDYTGAILWPKEKDGKTFYSGKISEPFVKSAPQNNNDLHKKGEQIREAMAPFIEDEADDKLPF